LGNKGVYGKSGNPWLTFLQNGQQPLKKGDVSTDPLQRTKMGQKGFRAGKDLWRN